jgi:hypothetical protein
MYVLLKIAVLWNVTPGSLIDRCSHNLEAEAACYSEISVMINQATRHHITLSS